VKFGALALGAVICTVRLANVYDTERRLASAESSAAFDRSFTTATTFVAQHWREANFVAADYGFGAQVYCFSGGSHILAEPFWNYSGVASLREMLTRMPARPIYVLYNDEPNPVPARVRDGIRRDLGAVLGKCATPREKEIRDLKGVRVEVCMFPGGGSVSGPPAQGRRHAWGESDVRDARLWSRSGRELLGREVFSPGEDPVRGWRSFGTAP
jgi:hypothetical protein